MSNGNEGVLHIPQISKTGTSPSDCLLSKLGYSLEESYCSAEMQSVYSTTPADLAGYTQSYSTKDQVKKMLIKRTIETKN